MRTTIQAFADALGADYATTSSLLRSLATLKLVQAVGVDKKDCKGKGKLVYEIDVGVGAQLDWLFAAALDKLA